MNRFRGIIHVAGKIECLTGLHIGGSEQAYQIGGMDLPVIRALEVQTGQTFPYIPGSSLKGRLRSLAEWQAGKVESDKPHDCDDLACVVCRLFGTSNNKWSGGPTRLLVRDAHVDQHTRTAMLEMERRDGLPKVELKTENSIQRLRGAAENPRTQERVAMGSRFDFHLLLSLYELDGNSVNDFDLFDALLRTMRLLEHSYLGGSGSRGYGQIRFHLQQPAPFLSETMGEARLVIPDGLETLRPLDQVSNGQIIEWKDELKKVLQ